MDLNILFIVLSFIFGACIGSFLNVVIWRLPREEKLNGRSECPNCHHQLAWYDLIPVFSYLFLRGRCRYCQTKISPRYWMIELITASLFALATVVFFPTQNLDYILLLKLFFVIAVCIAVFVIDLEHYLILDKVIFPAIAGVLLFNLALDLFSHHRLLQLSSLTMSGLLAAAIAGIFFWLLWAISKGRWMGFGDVKFAVLMGLILGFPVIFIGLFLSFILGSLVGLPLVILGKKGLSSQIPFGTFLTISTIIALFWGNALWQWYFSLISF